LGYRENNPILVAVLRLFAAKSSSAESEALIALRMLVEQDSVGDPMGRVFLGHFYAGLWFKSVRGDATAAAAHIAAAAKSPHGKRDGIMQGLISSFQLTSSASAAAAPWV